jgi:hypothetical protein
MHLTSSPHRTWAAFVPAVLVLALVSLPSSGAAPDRTRYSVDASGRPLIHNSGQVYLNARLPVPARVADLLRRMTLEEKVGQMTQAERGAVTNDATLVTTWRLGSVLSGGGSVVSGRPQVIPPAQLGTIDALVASWLPGSQGEGVADILFGNRPFTGKLCHSWPRSADQHLRPEVPPLYPFAGDSAPAVIRYSSQRVAVSGLRS